MRRRRSPEIIAGKVNSDGTLATTTDPRVTTAKTGTGGYAVYLPSDMRYAAMTVTPAQAAGWIAIAVPGSNGYQVNTYASTTAALGDAPFSFVVVGTQQ